MNKIILKGLIRNIQYSHTIDNVEYDKAELVVPRSDDKEDIISLRFKKFSNPYKDDQQIALVGNVRSYSQKISENKNSVEIYVFSYFDVPIDAEEDITNYVELDGRICKVDELRTTNSGKQNLHAILANNIINKEGNQKLNNYLPLVFWGKLANNAKDLRVNDKIKIKGQFHSRSYKKIISDDGDFEIRIVHEIIVNDFEVVERGE